MPGRPAVPETVLHAMLQDYQAGIVQKQLTWKYSVSHRTIQKYVKRFGLPQRRPSRAKGRHSSDH
jgi:hypothetical protein